jgi:group I intron endonuclease
MRKQKRYHFIYKTTNLLNGRYYIGMHSTDDMNDGYMGSGIYLRRSLNKHGTRNHKREILEYCKTRQELKSREEEIVNLNEIAKKECMNLRVGGSGSRYIRVTSDETRKKLSESHKGQIPWIKGKTHSEETRRKLSEAGKGRKLSVDHKQKITNWNEQRWNTISDTDRQYMKSKFIHNVSHSEESKQKMSKAHMGKKLSEEHKQKISNANKNRSEETRRKISEGNKGKKTSDETKLKISKANSKPQKKITCPYCNKTGGTPNMKRYHFDNCKNKKL